MDGGRVEGWLPIFPSGGELLDRPFRIGLAWRFVESEHNDLSRAFAPTPNARP
jgi:hypothetical protein